MVSIVCYGVGTGYNSSTGCPTGVKDSFDYNEKIWATHCWDGLSGGELFRIQWQREVSGSWETELLQEATNSEGYSKSYHYESIQNYTPGNWRVNFYCGASGPYRTYFTIALETPTEGHIHGIVKDAISGNPISGVNVNFGNFSTQTFFDGTYDLVLTEGYSAMISFSKIWEYETYEEPLTAGPGDDITLNVNLNPLVGHITGVVKEYPTGNPLESVKVSFANKITYTDNEGNYDLVLTGGYSGIIKFELDGYRTYEEPITAGPGDDINISPEMIYIGGIKETINWESKGYSGSHTFYLLSFVGLNIDGTIQGFQVEKRSYKIVTTPVDIRMGLDELTTLNVLQKDVLTMIVENYDDSTGEFAGVYDYKIEKLNI